MKRSSYIVWAVSDEGVSIEDIGDHTRQSTVTNDAENVVKELYAAHGNVRFFYIDSEGDSAELLHQDGTFTGFAPC